MGLDRCFNALKELKITLQDLRLLGRELQVDAVLNSNRRSDNPWLMLGGYANGMGD